MSPKAQNSIRLYKGGDPATIEQLLHMQDKSVVNELKEYFQAQDLKELSVKLSIGK